jgi:hypothetical protein
MENKNWTELCVHCEEIEVDGQTVYCRTDESNCSECGNNEFILIDADQELGLLNKK